MTAQTKYNNILSELKELKEYADSHVMDFYTVNRSNQIEDKLKDLMNEGGISKSLKRKIQTHLNNLSDLPF